MTDKILKIDNLMEFNYNYTLLMPSYNKYKIDIWGNTTVLPLYIKFYFLPTFCF